MGAAREKDQADFDLETFVDLFDTAISSDNPAVQRALKNLLMIATIVNAEDPEAGMRQGPLRRVIDDQRNIIRRLERVENDNTKIYPQTPGTLPPGGAGGPFGPVPLGPYYPPQPLTWPNTGTGSPPPNQIWCSSQGASSTAFDDQFISKDKLTAMTISAVQEIDKKYNDLLDKLETK
jgi:hypothetical protein